MSKATDLMLQIAKLGEDIELNKRIIGEYKKKVDHAIYQFNLIESSITESQKMKAELEKELENA